MQTAPWSSQALLCLDANCEGWESGKTVEEKEHAAQIRHRKGSCSHGATLGQTWSSSASCFHVCPFIFPAAPSSAPKSLSWCLSIPCAPTQRTQPPCPARGSFIPPLASICLGGLLPATHSTQGRAEIMRDEAWGGLLCPTLASPLPQGTWKKASAPSRCTPRP